MCQPFVNKSSVQIAQVDEAGRARAQSRDLSAFRELSRWVESFVFFRGSGYVRKKKLRQFVIVHMLILRFLFVLIDTPRCAVNCLCLRPACALPRWHLRGILRLTCSGRAASHKASHSALPALAPRPTLNFNSKSIKYQ